MVDLEKARDNAVEQTGERWAKIAGQWQIVLFYDICKKLAFFLNGVTKGRNTSDFAFWKKGKSPIE